MGCELALIGDASCGKTSLVKAFIDKVFTPNVPPTLFDHYTAKLNYYGKEHELRVWDCGGSEEFLKYRQQAYDKIDTFIICYDLSNPQALKSIEDFWVKEIMQSKFVRKNPTRILVGCK